MKTPNPQDINKPKDNSSERLRNIFKDNTSLLDEPEVKELIVELQKAERRGELKALESVLAAGEGQTWDEQMARAVGQVAKRYHQVKADLNKMEK